MKVLDRKLLRDMRGAKGLLMLISSIIAVGVMCFVAMQSAYRNLDRAKSRYYERCRMADFWIDLKKAPVADLGTLSTIAGIQEFHPRIQFPVTVDLEGVTEPVNGTVLSLPDRPAAVINGIVLRQGGYFTPTRSNEVLVNEKFARTHRLYPGQTIHLLLNNRRQALHIVGTAISSEFTYLVGGGSLVPDPKHFGVFYLKRSHAEEVFDFEGAANQVVGQLSPESRARVKEILRRAETLLETYGVVATTPRDQQVSHQFLSSELDGLGSFATVVPGIFLVVAALVLNILVNRMARRQRVVVGTLKALGYEDRQVFWHFLFFSISVGVLGGVLGSLFGYLASAGMTHVYRWFFEFPDLRSGFHWYTNGLGLFVSVLCASLGGLHGARTMLRLQPAEAMRPEPPRKGGAIWLESVLGAAWNRLTASWRMVLRALFRNRLRTATGVFAATMGSGLLVCGFMMTEAQSYLIDFQFYRQVSSDVDLVFKDEQGREALSEVSRLPGVDHAEPLLNVSCTFTHGPYRRKGGVTGLASTARLTVPRDSRGRPVRIPDKGLVMTRSLADILHVDQGQQITFTPARGERRPIEAIVTKIADSYMGLAVYANIDYLSSAIGESFAMSGAQLVIDNDPATLAALYRRLKNTPGLQAIQSRRDMIENLTETLLQNQFVFIGVMVAFSGTIFLGSIVNASMVSLAERQAEVATFRALGYGSWRIGGLFFRESMLTNLTGALLGLPVGYFLTWLTAISYNNETIRLPVVSASWVWWTTLAIAVVFALMAHGVVQWNISRMNFLAALKVQE